MADDAQATPVVADDPQAKPTQGALAIGRVADEVLPALIARLSSSDLGELEVAEKGWRVRLRRDLSALREDGAGVPGSSGTGHAGHGAGIRGAGIGSSAQDRSSANAATTASGSPSGARSSVVRRAAASGAVGYFTPRDGLATGQAVRSGDVLGMIDVLGVSQPVVAPTDGVVGRILAAVGEAVEYGQELVRIDGIERLVES